MSLISFSITNYTTTLPGEIVITNVNTTHNHTVVSFNATMPLLDLTIYQINVHGESELGLPMLYPFASTFRSVGDGKPPTPVYQSVPAGATKVPMDSEITITFNQAMDTTKTQLAVTAAAPTAESGNVYWLPGDKTWVYNNTGLSGFTVYTVKGAAFNADDDAPTNVDFTFRTVGVVSVTSITPSNDGATSDVNAPIVVTFSHPVMAESVPHAFQLFSREGENQTVAVHPPTQTDNQTYTFTHEAAFTTGSAYAVLVLPFLVRDQDGTVMQEPFVSGFSVVVAGTPAPSSGGLSGGAIAGIVIGVIAGVAILGGVVYYCRKKRRNDYDALK